MNDPFGSSSISLVDPVYWYYMVDYVVGHGDVKTNAKINVGNLAWSMRSLYRQLAIGEIGTRQYCTWAAYPLATCRLPICLLDNLLPDNLPPGNLPRATCCGQDRYNNSKIYIIHLSIKKIYTLYLLWIYGRRGGKEIIGEWLYEAHFNPSTAEIFVT